MGPIQHDETWRQLHERLRGIAKRRAALDAEEARCLREAHDIKVWRRLGYVHMNEYLERELGYAPQVGVERLRVALALATLPRTEASLTNGWLSYSAVRELTRIATADTEQEWLDKARGKNLREIEAMVAGRKRGDRPEDPRNPDLTKRVLRLELAPAAFALFRQTQSAMADEHGGHLDDGALIELLCRRALEGAPGVDRPPYQIAITLCEWCGRGWQNGAGREIDIGPEVVARARCDAELIGSLDADEPERLRASVTPRLRRQLLARDHHRCTVPGCRSSRNLDVHHIEYQSHGGGHEMWNLTTTCSAHHQSVHDGLLTIRGKAPHSLEFEWRAAPAPINPTTEAVQAPPATTPTIERAQSTPAAAPTIEPARSISATGATREPARAISATSAIGATREPARAISATGATREPARAISATGATGAIREPARAMPAAGSSNELARAIPPAWRMQPAAIDESVRMALVTAGYRAGEARVAVEKARPHVGESATLEQVLREALRQCASTVAIHIRPSSS